MQGLVLLKNANVSPAEITHMWNSVHVHIIFEQPYLCYRLEQVLHETLLPYKPLKGTV